jgi:hypothetical protein
MYLFKNFRRFPKEIGTEAHVSIDISQTCTDEFSVCLVARALSECQVSRHGFKKRRKIFRNCFSQLVYEAEKDLPSGLHNFGV